MEILFPWLIDDMISDDEDKLNMNKDDALARMEQDRERVCYQETIHLFFNQFTHHLKFLA